MQDVVGKAKSFVKEKWQEYVEDLDFPATKAEIVSHAEEKNAPEAVIGQLDKLPDKTYDSMGDVAAAAGKSLF